MIRLVSVLLVCSALNLQTLQAVPNFDQEVGRNKVDRKPHHHDHQEQEDSRDDPVGSLMSPQKPSHSDQTMAKALQPQLIQSRRQGYISPMQSHMQQLAYSSTPQNYPPQQSGLPIRPVSSFPSQNYLHHQQQQQQRNNMVVQQHSMPQMVPNPSINSIQHSGGALNPIQFKKFNPDLPPQNSVLSSNYKNTPRENKDILPDMVNNNNLPKSINSLHSLEKKNEPNVIQSIGRWLFRPLLNRLGLNQ